MILLLALAGSVLVAWADYAGGLWVSLSLLYVAPVALAAWKAGRRSALLQAFSSAGLWLAVDRLSPGRQPALEVSLWNALMQMGFFVVLGLALSDLRATLDHERSLARTDPLTGAANARAFREAAEVEMARARRTGRPLTLVYLDLDNFKRVNDGQGHAAGDALLKTFAEAARGRLRATDVLARIGGDEFAILLPDAGLEDARKPLEALRTALPEVPFSAGASTFVQAPGSVDEMLRKADALMYSVKSGGKNRLAQESHGG